MMNKKILLLLFGALLIPTVLSAYDLYVQSVKAPVYAMPDMGSTIKATYEKGDRLTGLEDKGNWHMIKIDGGTGWVYRFLVADRPPPETGAGELIDQYSNFSAQARRRPSSYAAAAAARGLREKDPDFAEKYQLDYEALAKVEAIEITEKELTSFIRQGMENEKTN